MAHQPEELLTYEIDDEESIPVAVVAAFQKLDSDLLDKETELIEYVNMDSLKNMRWDSNDSLRVSTMIWGHPVSIASREITIYSKGKANSQPVPASEHSSPSTN